MNLRLVATLGLVVVVAFVGCISAEAPEAPAPVAASAPASPLPALMTATGYVTGFDAFGNAAKKGEVMAFVGTTLPKHCGPSPNPPGQEIQVTTGDANLQLALQLATATCSQVEVSYYDNAGLKTLDRVRLLDR